MKLDETCLNINLDALEVEAARQARLTYLASKELAEAKQAWKMKTQEKDLIHAAQTKLVRSTPSKFGLASSPTETAIKSVVASRKAYKQIVEQEATLQYEVDILKGLVNALDHKKRMIEMEITLHGQNYFATPYIKSAAWKEMIDTNEKRTTRRRVIKRKKVKK